ncbi:MAG: 50S ribosomal protein L6 [Chloroflexota bacterium]|nr:MAG: 50S ribosomal protein L6 [Chloroflexota bacterium]
MSRIGKMPVALPKGVTVSIDGTNVKVKGPKGELSQTFHEDMTIAQEDGKLVVSKPDDPAYDAMHGLTRALLNNMVKGVTDGFSKTLEIEGVGYRGELQGKNLVLALGYSHPVPVEPPPGINFSVDKSQRVITVEGADKQTVGQVAANIRSLRPPEPYKGKGIRYQGEKIRRKAGKAGKAGAK